MKTLTSISYSQFEKTGILIFMFWGFNFSNLQDTLKQKTDLIFPADQRLIETCQFCTSYFVILTCIPSYYLSRDHLLRHHFLCKQKRDIL